MNKKMNTDTKNINKNWKSFAIGLAVLCLAAAGLLLLYLNFRPDAVKGSKTVVLDVIYEDSSTETYTVQTEAEYLEQAISDMEGLTVGGSRTEQFGLMILNVNGVEADYNKNGAFWSIYLDDTPCNYGVSQQPIEDGQHYQIIYTTGDAS